MKQVTCRKLGSTSSLTVRKTYDVIDETENRYVIINDRGIQANYGKNLFNDPVEVPDPVVDGGGGEAPRGAAPEVAQPRRRPGRPSREEVAARAGVIPPAVAVPIRIVNNIDFHTEVGSDDSHRKFTIHYDFGAGFSNSFDSGYIIDTHEIASSCGIKSLDGLDNLKSSLGRFRTQFQAFVNANVQNFVLDAGISIDETMAQLTMAVIQDLIASYQGDDAHVEAGIIILSTTEASIDEMPALRAALNHVSSGTIEVTNPNSGNDIIMWNIAVEA